jgi:hypothetical protein
MKLFAEVTGLVSNAYQGQNEVFMIRKFESPPIILSGPMFKRIFQLTEKEALHSIGLNDLKNRFPKVQGRAKQISTFTQMQPNSQFWKGGINDEDRPGGLILHVKGNVTGQFNLDMYTEILRGGRRVIMLNDDTLEEQEFEDELKHLQGDLRKLVHTIFIKKLGIKSEDPYNFFDNDYPDEILNTELDGRQKATLIKNYMTGMEKLVGNKKYKEAVSDMMFDMIAVGDYEYNEVVMEKVKLLAIYVTSPDIDRSEVDELKKQFKVPVYPKTSRSQIEKVLQSINS